MFNVFVPQVRAEGQAQAPDLKVRRRGVGLPVGRAFQPDVDTLQAEWYYDWKCTPEFLEDDRYVPMSWTGGQYLPMLPYSYTGYLMALNEPDNDGQLGITPLEAVVRINYLQLKYPVAKLIIGGVSAYGSSWLKAFVTALGDYRPAGWHVHGYCEWGATADDLMTWFKFARETCPGGAFWVSEFADCDGGSQAKSLMHQVHDCCWINRYAWFATRVEKSDWFLPKHWQNPALIEPDGQLSAYGRLYTGARDELPF